MGLATADIDTGDGARLPLYDRAHLASFTGGDVVLERALIRDFCMNAREQLGSMMKDREPKAWRDHAHRLKGGARGVGMRAIAILCERAEAMDFSDANQRFSLLAEIDFLLERLSIAVA